MGRGLGRGLIGFSKGFVGFRKGFGKRKRFGEGV